MGVHVPVFAVLPLLLLSVNTAGAEDVAELWRGGGFAYPASVSANASDGSCWVADRGGDVVAHLSSTGQVLWQGANFAMPESVSVNPSDGSCWVADAANYQVVHLSAGGEELWRGGHYSNPLCVCVDPGDGSCWVADASGGGGVVHLSESGEELWRSTTAMWPVRLSVNPSDGSCWIADTPGNQVIHLSASGEELWRGGGFSLPRSVSVSAADGSCWVADGGHGEAVHLSATGEELWRGGVFAFPWSVCLNPSDGSCWVADQGGTEVTHLSASGEELWQGGGFATPESVSVNPSDGSCWVADSNHGQVVHLGVLGDVFADVNPYFWAYQQIEACFAAGIVAGYGDGLYHPEYSVSRDQMAVYIARAIAGGDDNVPEFTGTPTFSDVDDTFWALKYIEYAVDQAVVTGYEDGTYHPEYEVTRDQMAVYVARSLVAPSGEAGLADYVPADPRSFPDVLSDFWAWKHVEYCVENGVVSGYEDGLYHPEIVVTRDQMAVYVARAFGLEM